MIQAKTRISSPAAWQRELAQAFTRPDELLEFLQLPAQPRADSSFPLRVPRGYAARMIKGDPRDPLFLQVWPQSAEQIEAPGFISDAVGDLQALRDGGLIHKYRGRALVIATGACAVHCRYCFRREFPYGEHLAARDHWSGALKAIAADRSIEEVILSGGDPLSLADDKLAEFAQALEFLPQLRRLRIHTRQPVVLPERVDDRLCAWLSRGRLRKIMVIHANHAQELDASVIKALNVLRETGTMLLNQSVLLRGINDSADTLVNLSESLFAAGVLPYYLHLLDRVRGTAHFEVEESRALSLMREMSARLPGYLVPKLAREHAGDPAKRVLAW
ncbi:MAG: EF-P beta-lysylation protein EpmB [Pseudomonadota bacterium]